MKQSRPTTVFLVGLFLIGMTSPTHAALIDFETVPGSAPADQLAISTQYSNSFGVTFGLDNDNNGIADPGVTPFLEQVGGADPGVGFANHLVGDDQADPGLEPLLGDYFLRFGTLDTGAGDSALLITYSAPVGGASAQIWDIDGSSNGTEQWLIQALANDGSVFDSILSPEGVNFLTDPFEGKPWTWSFNHASADIFAIRIDFVGTKTSNVGLAFDRFNTNSGVIPAPGAVWLFGSALGLLGWLKRTTD